MKQDEKQRVADVLIEKPLVVKIGWLIFVCRPLTLAQIYEMGATVNDIDISDLLDEKKLFNAFAAVLKHYGDAKKMIDAYMVCLTRKRWKRWLFRRYVKRRLTVNKFNELISFAATSFNANFFLTSIIFLRQASKMTEPSPTTAPGQQWEE